MFNPREDDNLGTMVIFHRRYRLGDKHDHTESDFTGWDELEEHLVKEHKAALILPLYLYDHSGLRMKVGSFQGLLPQGHAEFDSGRVGFIFTTKEAIRKWFDCKVVGKRTLTKAEKNLLGEVEEYDKYLVYGEDGEPPEDE